MRERDVARRRLMARANGKRYFVCQVDYGDGDAGPWFKAHGEGTTSRLTECHLYTTDEAVRSFFYDENKTNLRMYRSSDVVSDDLGVAYVRHGAKPVAWPVSEEHNVLKKT